MQDKEISVISLHSDLLKKQKTYAEQLKSVTEKMNRILMLPQTNSSKDAVPKFQERIAHRVEAIGKFDQNLNKVKSKMLSEEPNYVQLEKNLLTLGAFIDKQQVRLEEIDKKIAALENDVFEAHESVERQKDIVAQEQKLSEKFQDIAQKKNACNSEISKILKSANTVASKFNLLANAPSQSPENVALYKGCVDSISQSYRELISQKSLLDQTIKDYSSQTNLSFEDKTKKLNELENKVNEVERESQKLAEQLNILQSDQFEGKNLSEITKSSIKEDAAKKIVHLEDERNSLVEKRNLLGERIQKLSNGTVRPQQKIVQQKQSKSEFSPKQTDFNQINQLKQIFPGSLNTEITQRTEKQSIFTEMVRGILTWLPAWFPFYEDANKFVEEQDKLNVEIQQINDLQNKINAIPDNSKLEDNSVVAVLDFWQTLKEGGLELSMRTNMLDTLQSAKGAMDVADAIKQYHEFDFERSKKEREILEVNAELEKFDAVPEQIDLSEIAQEQVVDHAAENHENSFSIFSEMWETPKKPAPLPLELEKFQQTELRRQAELKSGNPFELYNAGHKSDAEAVIRHRNWPALSRNGEGNTMLHLALQQNNFDRDMMRVLRKSAKSQDKTFSTNQWKEIVNAPNANGETPLLLVVSNEHERSADKKEIAIDLMTAGAEVNERIVQAIVKNEDNYMMEELMKQDSSFVSMHVSFSDNFEFWAKVMPNPIDVLDKNGHTLLYAAIKNEDLPTVNKLITLGAKVSEAELSLVKQIRSEQSAGESIKSIWANRPSGDIYKAVKGAAAESESHVLQPPR